MKTDNGEIVEYAADDEGLDIGKIVKIRQKVNDILTMSIPFNQRADLIAARIEEIPLTDDEAEELKQVEQALRMKHLLRKRSAKV